MCEDPIFHILILILTVCSVYRFLNGDPTGYSYHVDFFNGWQSRVLQRAINECHFNLYGDPLCCVAAGTFTINQDTWCYVSNTVDEISTSSSLPSFLPLNVCRAIATCRNLTTLPGANPVQVPCYEEYIATYTPAIVGLVYVSTEESTVLSGIMQIVVLARIVDVGGREPVGTCPWTGGGRGGTQRIPQVVVLLGVLMMTLGLV